ncbi:hypothetical protein SDC9_178804 [bioreactor metagenome]|uniref:Uncharacterized protein n=1 Tax=bioreactor metagenome TaxID=1076179 RepID=A0A645GY58_9ZZZZ
MASAHPTAAVDVVGETGHDRLDLGEELVIGADEHVDGARLCLGRPTGQRDVGELGALAGSQFSQPVGGRRLGGGGVQDQQPRLRVSEDLGDHLLDVGGGRDADHDHVAGMAQFGIVSRASRAQFIEPLGSPIAHGVGQRVSLEQQILRQPMAHQAGSPHESDLLGAIAHDCPLIIVRSHSTPPILPSAISEKLGSCHVQPPPPR